MLGWSRGSAQGMWQACSAQEPRCQKSPTGMRKDATGHTAWSARAFSLKRLLEAENLGDPTLSCSHAQLPTT